MLRQQTFIQRGLAIFLLILISTVASARQNEPEKRLLIVATQQFQTTLTDYVRYKKRQLPTDLISLENVLKTSKGVDDPEKLKRYLYSAWKERNVGYVLLVGDADVMPVRFMVLD